MPTEDDLIVWSSMLDGKYTVTLDDDPIKAAQDVTDSDTYLPTSI